MVEDEEYLRKEIALTTPWQDLGCALIGEAVNGASGFELIEKTRPDLIITDIRMPGMDGLEMLSRLNESLGDKRPYAILLTGHTDFEYARQAIRIGVGDYLLKPVDDTLFHSLLLKTAQKLEKRNARRRAESELEILDKGRLALFKEFGDPVAGDNKDEYVKQAIEYIREHYIQDISLADAAGNMGITQGYLSRIFKEKTTYTFLEYLTYYRLRKAVKLLHDRSLRINEIARLCGFQDHGYFSQLFRRYLGVTPGQFRKGNS
nr:helix-turn-helix domain-containing protein [Spirochaeta isovalerica]